MRKPVTIRDVARVAGVSPATVSFVLNNGPRPVSAATRLRVEEVVRELNFRPNAVARGLARRRMNILGVHFCHVESPIVTNFYATGLLGGIFAVAAERHFDVLLLTQPWRNAHHSLSALEDGRTDGLLLVAPDEHSGILKAVSELQIPLAAVAAPPEAAAQGVLTVGIDNARAMHDVIGHLCGLGHRRIAHITGELPQYDAHARRDAFVAAINRAGLCLPDGYLVEGDFADERQSGVSATVRELLTLPTRPTAIVCASDRIAHTAITTAQQMGLSVPEDVSIVGFDDAPIALQTTPLLTTIRQPLYEMGMQAARLLIDRIAGRDIGSNYRLRVPELLIRESTAAPPAE